MDVLRVRRSVERRAFRALLWRALRRTVPLAAAAGLCAGCFMGMFVSDVPWLDRLIIGSPLFGRLLAIVVCPAVALVLSDIFVGMEAAMALLAAADQGTDEVWASLGFAPERMLVSTRRLALYLTAPALYAVAWLAVSQGFGRYVDWVAGKGHLVWMPLLADAPLAYGCFITLLGAWFVDRATLADIRAAPVLHWQTDRRWTFVLRRQFMALGCGLAVFAVSFVFFSHWTL